MQRFIRRRWQRIPGRAEVAVRVPSLTGALEEFRYTGRPVTQVDGYVVLRDAVALAAGPNRTDVPVPGEVWLRRETIVHLHRPGA